MANMSEKQCLVVVNPHGGTKKGLAILDQVRPVFQQAKWELDVRVTESSGHAQQIGKTEALEAYDCIGVIGGDGTVHEVINGLMQRFRPFAIPLGFIPAGSGNTLHQHLQCTDPLDAARRIVAGRPCPLDVVRVTMNRQVVYCVDLIGWGGVADINCMAERLRRVGPARYTIAAIWHVFCARRRRAKVVLDGHTIDDEYLFAIACNTKFTGKGMKLAPRAEIGDGKIDVVLVRRASQRELLKLFMRVHDGSHVKMDCVEYHQVRSFAIESDTRDILDLDGEIKGHAPFHAEVLPGALSVLM
jgi:YegS/Rv2252/BmrU family lipid kinase